MTRNRWYKLGVIAALSPAVVALIAALLPGRAVLMGAGEGDPRQLTDINEVIMYGIDADTYELLRYNFDTDEYVKIGVVMDQNGNEVTDVESMAFIPHGPDKGLYGTANFYETKPTKLIRINALNADAWVYPDNLGFEKGEGLVAAQDPETWDWFLLAATKHADPGDKNHSLIRIDPATGVGTLLMSTDERYQGLAQGQDGTIFGSTNSGDLWTIDLVSGTETRIGSTGYTKVEALEYAFGDNEPRIKVPLEGLSVVPDSWTEDGVLFGFSDNYDALLIIDASTGHSVKWNCSFATIDCEGLVFTTHQRDLWGAIISPAGD